jgi:hypothetical protein
MLVVVLPTLTTWSSPLVTNFNVGDDGVAVLAAAAPAAQFEDVAPVGLDVGLPCGLLGVGDRPDQPYFDRDRKPEHAL